MSVHAPYYINLAAENSFDKNFDYIEQSVRAARMLGADRVVIHPGSGSQLTREKAFLNVFESFSKIFYGLSEKGYDNIIYCPETMGKINQIGDLAEVAELCGLDDRIYPTIDFAHLHARSLGGIKGKEDFERIIAFLENAIGREKTNCLHAHFSKIEYTRAGEKMHKNFSDKEYGPDFGPLAEVLVEKNMSPRIICESRGTQDIDAKEMLEIYNEKRKRLAGDEISAVKSPDEIEKLRMAAHCTQKILEETVLFIKPGVSEIDIADEIRHQMDAMGLEPSFDTIVASGENGAQPHAVPSEREIFSRRHDYHRPGVQIRWILRGHDANFRFGIRLGRL